MTDPIQKTRPAQKVESVQTLLASGLFQKFAGW
jgi:hypothetical protein